MLQPDPAALRPPAARYLYIGSPCRLGDACPLHGSGPKEALKRGFAAVSLPEVLHPMALPDDGDRDATHAHVHRRLDLATEGRRSGTGQAQSLRFTV
jgi:hypothetical protein